MFISDWDDLASFHVDIVHKISLKYNFGETHGQKITKSVCKGMLPWQYAFSNQHILWMTGENWNGI